MKKIYITPAAEVIRIEKALLTANSAIALDKDTELGDGNSGELLSRKFVFDDDEGEDY